MREHNLDDIAIEHLGFPGRLRNALWRHKIRTIGRLADCEKLELMMVGDVGKKSRQEIARVVATYKAIKRMSKHGHATSVADWSRVNEHASRHEANNCAGKPVQS